MRVRVIDGPVWSIGYAGVLNVDEGSITFRNPFTGQSHAHDARMFRVERLDPEPTPPRDDGDRNQMALSYWSVDAP